MTAAPTFQTADYEEQLGESLDFRGLRMPALALDQMLGAAFVHADRSGEALAPFDAIQLRLADDLLVLTATDRYTAHREQRAVNQEGPGSAFLLQLDDLRTIRSLLRSGLAAADKPDKPVLPVDLYLGDTGFLEVVLGERRVLCAPREAIDGNGKELQFPDVDAMIRAATERVEGVEAPVKASSTSRISASLRSSSCRSAGPSTSR
jgi:hypothetical protein